MPRFLARDGRVSRCTLRAPLLLGLLLVAGCAGPAGSPTLSARPPAATASSPTSSSGSAEPTPVDSGPPLPVLGTENFYADLLAQVGGSRVAASSLLNDPNADPHAFESSPQSGALVADSRLVIVNGLGYDAFMQKLLAASNRPDRVVINVQQLLGLPSDVNVHIWYDPATMPKVAEAAAGALTKLDPPNSGYFEARKAAYLAGLKPIIDNVAALKARFAGTPIAFTEDVAGYLTDTIGLVVKSPPGFMKAVEEGIDPGPADVAAERALFTMHLVKVLLYNSQVQSPITQQIHDLAQTNGVPIVGVAETIPSTYQHFQDWQVAQLDELEQALLKGA